jgi:hypothetical protein
MPQRASVFCNFYIRVDREALVSERALDVGSVAFKAMSTKNNIHTYGENAHFSLGALYKLHLRKNYGFPSLNIIIPGDQKGLFKLAVQLRKFFNSVIYYTATGYVLLVYLTNI